MTTCLMPNFSTEGQVRSSRRRDVASSSVKPNDTVLLYIGVTLDDCRRYINITKSIPSVKPMLVLILPVFPSLPGSLYPFDPAAALNISVSKNCRLLNIKLKLNLIKSTKFKFKLLFYFNAHHGQHMVLICIYV